MIKIPPDLLCSYDTLLAHKLIEPQRLPHYRKWLRFYLDFCNKYHFTPSDCDSLLHFTEKLRTKNQAEWLCKQAEHAVTLYCEMIEKDRGEPVDQSVIQESPSRSNSSPQVQGACPKAQVVTVPVSSVHTSPHGSSLTTPTPTPPTAEFAITTPITHSPRPHPGREGRRYVDNSGQRQAPVSTTQEPCRINPGIENKATGAIQKSDNIAKK